MQDFVGVSMTLKNEIGENIVANVTVSKREDGVYIYNLSKTGGFTHAEAKVFADLFGIAIDLVDDDRIDSTLKCAR